VLGTLLVEYALNAAGLVPHMVFLVDFVARGLGEGLAAGARYWVLFGVGATLGPVAAGLLADRVGFRAALRLALGAQAALVGVLAWAPGPAVLVASSLVIGAAVPGATALVLGRVQELVPPGAHAAAWGWATTAFALGQAAAAYGLSFVFAGAQRHEPLFALGAVALLAALALDVAAGRARA
jgi:predicted MFS family arabinose efflux permease